MTDNGEQRWVTLKEALAILAFAGEAKPIECLIGLLCKGKLSAKGDYRFKTFRESQHFESDVEFEVIPAARWAELAEALANPRSVTLSLPQLWGEYPTGELDLNNNGFRLASEDGDWLQPGSSETWLSVSNANVWESELINAIKEFAPQQLALTKVPINSGGRPPKADWEQGLIHLFGKIYADGWKPANISELSTELQSWLLLNGVEVSDTAAKQRARPLFNALKVWDSNDS